MLLINDVIQQVDEDLSRREEEVSVCIRGCIAVSAIFVAVAGIVKRATFKFSYTSICLMLMKAQDTLTSGICY